MRHHHELGALAVLCQVVCEVADIGIIQGSLNFVQDAEGSRLQLQHGEEDGNGRQCPLTAGKQGQQLQLLSRGLSINLNAAVQGIVRIHQGQRRMTAAKQPGEGFREVPLQLGEVIHEGGLHLFNQPLDQLPQILFCLLQILLLGGQFVKASLGVRILLHGVHVHRPQCPNLAGQLCRPPVCADRVKAFRLPELFRSGVGHFVGVPDPILQLLQVAFHLGSGQLRAVDTVAIPREGLVQVLHIRQGFFQLGLFPVALFF